MGRYFLFLLPFYIFGSLSVKTNSKNVCAINSSTGNIIYQKNMHEKLYPGSVTKVATALYLVEECDLDLDYYATCTQEPLKVTTEKKKVESNFTLPPYILEDDGVTLYLKTGERVKIDDLFHGMMVKSANDCANVLATVFGGTIPDFMFRVNKYLRTIGCKNTHFVNPHGLHQPDHVTTPYDLALMIKRAAAHPYLRKVMSTPFYVMEKTNLSNARELQHGTRLIIPDHKHFTPTVKGGKTGYHWRAKFNLGVFAENDDRQIVVVVNKSETSNTIFDDVKKVVSAIFEEPHKERILFNAEESKFRKSYEWADKELVASLKEHCILKYYPSEEEPLDVQVHWLEHEAAVNEGDLVGTLDIYSQSGIPLMQKEIYADHPIKIKWLKRVTYVINAMIAFAVEHPWISLLTAFILLLLIKPRRKKVV